MLLSVSPTVRYWTSWLIFVNAGAAHHGTLIFDFPVSDSVMNVTNVPIGNDTGTT
jgi:hypothetical protein